MSCQTFGILHGKAAARKDAKPHTHTMAPKASPVFFTVVMGASARRKKMIDNLTRIVTSMKRSVEAYNALQ